MARVSRAQLRKIAPRGKKALRASIDALWTSFPTDDFLAILNADLPDIENAASIMTWADQAHFRFDDTIHAMERFGGACPLDEAGWKEVKGRTAVLGPLVLSLGAAQAAAADILTQQYRVRWAYPFPRIQRQRKYLQDREEALRYSSRPHDIEDLLTSIAVRKAILISQAVLDRLLTIPDAWAARLRRCPGPRCRAPFFWNAHDRPAERICCSEACRKAHSRLSASADLK